MDSAHSWHPGTLRVAPQWALPVPLYPDELFSSWLTRAALSHGCDPLAFTGAIWPRWRVWTTDLDRQPPSERLTALTLPSGLSVEQLADSTLAPIALRLLGKPPPKQALWPWILTIGSRNRRRNGGLQYCPYCFAEDPIPYYRLQWRLAWHVSCERHGNVLLDRCPHCHATLEPHRLAAEAGNLNQCSTCRAPLSKVESPPAPLHVRTLQGITDQVLHSGQANLYGHPASPPQWFATMRIWMDLFRRGCRAKTAGVEQLAKAFCTTLTTIEPGMFETLRTDQRSLLLDAIGWLMSLDFDALMQLFKNSNLSCQSIFPDGLPDITAIRRLADILPDRPRAPKNKPRTKSTPAVLPPPRSRKQVEAMMRKLQQKMEPLT